MLNTCQNKTKLTPGGASFYVDLTKNMMDGSALCCSFMRVNILIDFLQMTVRLYHNQYIK